MSNSSARIDGNLPTWDQDGKRAALHYSLLLMVYALYGYQVCPFLEQLSMFELLAPVAAMLSLQWGMRQLGKRHLEREEIATRIRKSSWMDLGLFVFGGCALAFYNLFVHGFPLESGGKILVLFVFGGFYISLDLALEREYRLGQYLGKMGSPFPLSVRYWSVQRKFALFSSANLVVLATVSLLLVYKDLHWIAEEKPDLQMAGLAIMAELGFVVGVIGAYIIRVIRQYSRNLDAMLQAETQGLRAVADGNLEALIPVTTNDEFGHMADLSNQMIGQLRSSRDELVRTQDVTMMGLISLAAKRDNETGLHLKRTQTYVAMLAKALRRMKPELSDKLSDEIIDLLYKSAPLHDIGKVGVPDHILKKPGKLDDDEFAIMKTHAQIGAEALDEAEQALGGCSFLSMAKEIAATHHEKWDGSGYPAGLKGEDIPLSGRLMAVADVYDALRSPRVYKPGFTHSKAMAIILDGKGKHFDPELVEVLISIEKEINVLSEEMSDKVEQKSEERLEKVEKAKPGILVGSVARGAA
ncbi:HD-GYP domain-containing protein [Cohaesibacter gelatinilyticus]|uniref:HD domain-containing protein n=1 Tax=Cohaesibacter gelatinilyticus TaxID=372072 RepID=A0A285NHH0_9HYPH|nr:HD domain-containing phosphohydrolase [Cohaesibacter gelatinilyticus]SNZ08437.1 HD domain-containing protein [Cohaesibacter gelatinilyticus]